MPKRYLPHLMYNYTPAFKPKPPVPASVLSFDQAPARCIVINESLIPYLLGSLELWRWPDRFRGTQADQLHSVGIFQDLVAALMEGDCMPKITAIRIEECVLQVQVDGGPDWVNVGDISACGVEGPPGPAGADGLTPEPIWTGTSLAWDTDGDGFQDTGPVNLQGPAGPQGETGPQGPQGPQGETGPAGADGLTPEPIWTGTSLAWDTDGDGFQDTGPVNLQGPAGADGADGQPAPTPLIEIDPATRIQDGVEVSGYHVKFDMDADGQIDAGFYIFDGLPGVDGAPVPSVGNSRCGLSTAWVHWFLKEYEDAVTLLKQRFDAGLIVIDAAGDLIDTVPIVGDFVNTVVEFADNVQENDFNDLLAIIGDGDWLEEQQQYFYCNVFTEQTETITRDMLLQWANSVDQFYGPLIYPLRATTLLFVALVDMKRVNRYAWILRNNGDPDLCALFDAECPSSTLAPWVELVSYTEVPGEGYTGGAAAVHPCGGTSKTRLTLNIDPLQFPSGINEIIFEYHDLYSTQTGPFLYADCAYVQESNKTHDTGTKTVTLTWDVPVTATQFYFHWLQLTGPIAHMWVNGQQAF